MQEDYRMRTIFALVAASALALPAQIELVAPASNAVVRQLHTIQRAYAKAPWAECEKYFDGAENAQKLKSRGSLPVPVKLQWKGAATNYLVTVRRLPDGKVAFAQVVATNCVEVDSLDIATEWEWTVSAGTDSLVSRFKTEDRIPRLVRMTGTSNCRDVGGRRGLDGRRIRQGLVYRTAGLNSNAPMEYYTQEEILELERKGELEKMGHAGRSLHRKLARGEKLSSHASRNGLVKRKCFAPGARRLSKHEVARILSVYGIRSDIDLRTDAECYGMTGSPLGPSVNWFHISYSAYAGAFTDAGRAITKKVFDVFMDDDNYPIVFHCIGGADRTGTVAMLLEALLGVPEDELWRDYLTTGFVGGVSDPRHKQLFGTTMKHLKEYPGETLAEKAEAYFLKLGFTREDVRRLRERLLER
jgi:protein-tyrosine phosphatase